MSRALPKNIAILLTPLVLCIITCYGADLPDEKTLNTFAAQSKGIYQNFLSKTLYQRLSFQYNDGQLSDQHKTTLAEAVKEHIEKIKEQGIYWYGSMPVFLVLFWYSKNAKSSKQYE